MEADKVYDVGIVGLGYVGLTLATVLADAGNTVVGIEKRSDVVDLTNQGIPHFSEVGLKDALTRVTTSGRLLAAQEFNPKSHCQTYIITVGTPLSSDGKVRLDMIEAATRQVAENMPDGALVILRSTVQVETTRRIVAPILAATGKKFDIAMCPERTLEGRALQELRELPQIIGAENPTASDRAAAIFQRLTSSVVKVSSPEAAEIVKLIDNTFRDVQFAFANEVARLCGGWSGARAWKRIHTSFCRALKHVDSTSRSPRPADWSTSANLRKRWHSSRMRLPVGAFRLRSTSGCWAWPSKASLRQMTCAVRCLSRCSTR